MPTAHNINVEEMKLAAAGRWGEIISSLTGVDRSVFDGRNGPCPHPGCGDGGHDRFAAFRDFDQTGGCNCRKCHDKANGDGLSTLQWLKNWDFKTALTNVANYLSINANCVNGSSNVNGHTNGRVATNGKTAKQTRKICGASPETFVRDLRRKLTFQGKKPIDDAIYLSPNENGEDHSAEVRVYFLKPNGSRDKLVRPIYKDGHVWRLGNPPQRILHNLPQFANARNFAFVEGPKAAIAAAEMLGTHGYVVTTFHGGKDAPITEINFDPITNRGDVESILLLPDNDEDGGSARSMFKLKDHLLKVNPQLKITMRQLPNLPLKGDAYEFLEAGIKAGKTKEQIGAEALASPELKSIQDIGVLPEVALPRNRTTITHSATELGKLLANTGRFFLRGGSVMRLEIVDSQPQLQIVRAAALCSLLETVARLVKVNDTPDGIEASPTTCSEAVARLILECDSFKRQFPIIHVLTRCPVLVECDGQLFEISGYDSQSGILAGGDKTIELPLDRAIDLLRDVLADYKFATPGDFARAIASMITPGLVFGGLLCGRAPFDLTEADDSQAGKGYRNKLTCAIYNAKPAIVTQRGKGSVGSLHENLDAKLVSGASFISLDNLRGLIDIPAFESYLTEDNYSARVPYSSPIEIDQSRIMIMLTSNRAEVTTDLANRASCVRILKQPANYPFRNFPEGDLLDHIRGNYRLYLGAVFSIIREWHRRGRPQLTTANHDFRRWGQTLGYIIREFFEADLLEGHRAAQVRISSPGLAWLRDLALAVQRAGRAGQWLRSHQLLTIITDQNIETPGVDLNADMDEESEWVKASRKIGRKISGLFSSEKIIIDNFSIERQTGTDNEGRVKKEYAFFVDSPNSPQVAPQSNIENPQVPNTQEKSIGDLFSTTNTHIGIYAPIGDLGALGGTDSQQQSIPTCQCGSTQFDDVEIHDGQSVRRDCRQCNKTLGYPVWHGVKQN